MSRVPTAFVQAATRADERRVLATLTAAFANDPIARWVWTCDRAYHEVFPRFAAAFGGRAFAHGTADTMGADSAALWLPPGVAPDEGDLGSVLEHHVPSERQEALTALMQQMATFHPTTPHWYLPLIGVAPARQGHGLGATLLRHALARCDAEHLPAYLESSNPRNVPLYRRHGFEVVGRIAVDGSPVILPMVRPPRVASPGNGEPAAT